MNLNATPKTLSYKQKRSSEKLVAFDDSKLKTSFSPFFLKPAKFSSKKKELLIRPNKVFESSVINNDYKINGAKKKKFDTKSKRKEDQADMKISLQSLGSLDNVSPTIETQYEMYKPFYLEDPFTTYAKGIAKLYKLTYYILKILPLYVFLLICILNSSSTICSATGQGS